MGIAKRNLIWTLTNEMSRKTLGELIKRKKKGKL